MITLPEAEQRLVERCERWVAESVVPEAGRWERERVFPAGALVGAAELGLTRLRVSPRLGGMGASFACKARIAELLAGGDFGLAMSVVNSHNVAEELARWAPEAVVQRWVGAVGTGACIGCTALTEPDAGSDFAAIRTTAARTGDGWRLDGRKAWITNARAADVVIVYAQTQPGAGAAGIAAFVVDASRAGFARDDEPCSGAPWSMGTSGFRLDGYVARDEELLHPPGTGFERALQSINGARVYVAAMCCGMVAASLRCAAEHGDRRQAFGRVLREHQAWRFLLAEAAVDLRAARLMVADAAQAIDAGADVRTRAAAAKVCATRMAERHVRALGHALGAEGLRDRHPFMRHIVGAQVATLVDGSTEMLLERIARRFEDP